MKKSLSLSDLLSIRSSRPRSLSAHNLFAKPKYPTGFMINENKLVENKPGHFPRFIVRKIVISSSTQVSLIINSEHKPSSIIAVFTAWEEKQKSTEVDFSLSFESIRIDPNHILKVSTDTAEDMIRFIQFLTTHAYISEETSERTQAYLLDKSSILSRAYA